MSFLGKKHSEKTKRKISKASKGRKKSWVSKAKMMAEKNPMWRGDKVGYAALHDWIKRRMPKPKLCSLCSERLAYDLANISGEYKRDLNDWHWICRKCHMIGDGRLKDLIENGEIGRKNRWKNICADGAK